MLNWQELLISLNINANKLQGTDISHLETFYFEHISQEPLYDSIDTIDRKFNSLQRTISHFLETVYPIRTEKSADPFDSLGGYNAIQYASKKGYDVYLEGIFASDTSAIDLPTKPGLTPLHIAALHGHALVTKLLLKKGANPNVKTRFNQVPAHLALSFQPPIVTKDISTLRKRKQFIFKELLTTLPRSIYVLDKRGNTLAHIAAENDFSSILDDIHQAYPELLLMKNSNSHTPLHVSILNQNKDCIDVLIANTKLLTIADKNGRLPIHYAALHSGSDIFAKFAKNPFLNMQDSHLQTPLILASQQGNLDKVKLLISQGASITIEDQYGRNAFHYSVLSKNLDLINWLMTEVKEIDIDHQDKNGRTGLMELLIDLQDNKTAPSNLDDIVGCLLKAGSNQDLKDSSGQSLRDYLASSSAQELSTQKASME